MKRIIPNLWLDTQAEEAAAFYTSIFKDSRVTEVTHYPEAASEISGKPSGSVMTVAFELAGQEFLALNGGPAFKFNESISFIVRCEDQAEVDYYWEKMTAGGEESVCGWLQDKYGLSWQIVPEQLDALMSDTDPAKVERVTEAFLKMQKLDIAVLKQAAESVSV